MKQHIRKYAALAIASLGLAGLGTAGLAQDASAHDTSASATTHVRAKRISAARARTIALREVNAPGGRVASQELEHEKGHLVYSFDIKVPKKAGIEEVLVDARTGSIISHTHETVAKERREAAADAQKGTTAH